ncbi:MAG: hypothetical protein O2816_15660, partial [Planctomycetota bacterium]|nr:hypothetical protein [Planctomycetota bacterium]
YELEHGGSWELSRRMGDLAHALRDRRAALEHGQRMIEQGAPERAVESYFDQKASREDLTRIRVRELLALTDDAAAIEVGLAELSRNLYDTPQALDLLQKLRGRAARGDALPEGYTAAAWSQRLEEWTLRLYRTNPRLVAPRLEVLGRRRFALGSDEWVELLWLHHFLPREERPDLFGNRPGVRVVGEQETGPGERAVERFPFSPKVLAAAGRWARLEGDLDHAVAWGQSLCALLDEPEERERETNLRAQALARYAAELLLDSFTHPDLTSGSPTSLRLARLTYTPANASSGLVMVPDRSHAGLLLAQDLFGLGRIEEARAALAALPELHPEALLERLQRARVHIELGQVGAGLVQTLGALRVRGALAEQEPFDLLLDWQSSLDQELADLTAALVRAGLRGWVT